MGKYVNYEDRLGDGPLPSLSYYDRDSRGVLSSSGKRFVDGIKILKKKLLFFRSFKFILHHRLLKFNYLVTLREEVVTATDRQAGLLHYIQVGEVIARNDLSLAGDFHFFLDDATLHDDSETRPKTRRKM